MKHEVVSDVNYDYQAPGLLIDNQPWQAEIGKRLAEYAHPDRGGLDGGEPAFSLTAKPAEKTPEEKAAEAAAELEANAKRLEEEAREKASGILEKARLEAVELSSRMKTEAEKELEQLRNNAAEEGRKRGLDEGRREGLEKGKEEGSRAYSDLVKKWEGLVADVVVERKGLLGEMKPLLVELVGEALYRCLKKEAELHPRVVVEIAEEALKKAQDRVHLKLHLNPEDVNEIESQRERLRLSVGAGDLELVPDARIERGGCLLETEAGSVDARLSTVASVVKESLNSEIART